MRDLGPKSEIRRLAAPIGKALDWAWQRMHWWIAVMAVLYAFSGITVVKGGEVALILRWGRLVGSGPALQEHGPGLLFALPRPIDEVVRVDVMHVYEVPITTLARDEKRSVEADQALNTLDPVADGYALTGDENIVQVKMIARYRVRDPAEWAFYGLNAAEILRVEASSAMVRSLGEMGVDRVLSDGREQLVATATKRTQALLDDAHTGLELTSLELVNLAPPLALANDFDAVQSAFIEAQTQQSDAQAFAESAIPQAQAEVDEQEQAARADSDSALAAANGDADAFKALEKEYRANPAVVSERLYRNAVEQAISGAGRVRWIPPPVGGNYRGFRLDIGPAAGLNSGPGVDIDTGGDEQGDQ